MEQEQKRLLIRGARILNPARGEDYIGNILISGDRISAVSENLYDADAEVVDRFSELFESYRQARLNIK